MNIIFVFATIETAAKTYFNLLPWRDHDGNEETSLYDGTFRI